MDIANDAPQTDYVKYFTEQLPRDLAAMAALRDELAVRQGALSAAENAVKLKAEAQAYLATTKQECDALLADTKDKNAKAKAKAQAAEDREAAVKVLEDKLLAASDAAASDNEAQAQRLAIKEQALGEAEAKLAADRAALDAAQVALDARVKAFQDKVAALTA